METQTDNGITGWTDAEVSDVDVGADVPQSQELARDPSPAGSLLAWTSMRSGFTGLSGDASEQAPRSEQTSQNSSRLAHATSVAGSLLGFSSLRKAFSPIPKEESVPEKPTDLPQLARGVSIAPAFTSLRKAFTILPKAAPEPESPMKAVPEPVAWLAARDAEQGLDVVQTLLAAASILASYKVRQEARQALRQDARLYEVCSSCDAHCTCM